MSILFSVEILLDDILRFHKQLEASDIPVEQGVRDMALLESAVNAPFRLLVGMNCLVLFRRKLPGCYMA